MAPPFPCKDPCKTRARVKSIAQRTSHARGWGGGSDYVCRGNVEAPADAITSAKCNTGTKCMVRTWLFRARNAADNLFHDPTVCWHRHSHAENGMTGLQQFTRRGYATHLNLSDTAHQDKKRSATVSRKSASDERESEHFEFVSSSCG